MSRVYRADISKEQFHPKLRFSKWSRSEESNPKPRPYKGRALPTELQRRLWGRSERPRRYCSSTCGLRTMATQWSVGNNLCYPSDVLGGRAGQARDFRAGWRDRMLNPYCPRDRGLRSSIHPASTLGGAFCFTRHSVRTQAQTKPGKPDALWSCPLGTMPVPQGQCLAPGPRGAGQRR